VSTDTRLGVLLGMLVLLAVIWGMAFLSKHFERAAAAVAPLELVDLAELEVAVVGSGGTFENPQRRGPALVTGRGRELVLVDAGRGVADGLRRAAIPVQQPRTLLLTSLLPENTVGLAELWLQGWLAGATTPLAVYGPPGTRALVDALVAAQRAGAVAQAGTFALPAAGGALDARELADGEEFALGVLRVRAVALAGGPLPAFAYRVSDDAKTLAFAGATWDPDAIARAAERADLLFTEGVYLASLDAAGEVGADVAQLREEAKLHVALEAVGELATRAGVRGVVLTRLRPPPAFHFQYERLVRETFRGPVEVAEDGERFTP
jgi:ribonuclease Z